MEEELRGRKRGRQPAPTGVRRKGKFAVEREIPALRAVRILGNKIPSREFKGEKSKGFLLHGTRSHEEMKKGGLLREVNSAISFKKGWNVVMVQSKGLSEIMIFDMGYGRIGKRLIQ